MRRAAKIDGNQNEIVKKLRQCGVSVQILSAVGQGCPDLLCGWHGVNVLLELKDADQPESKQRLTVDEQQWSANWSGQWAKVNSFQQAMDAIIAVVKK